MLYIYCYCGYYGLIFDHPNADSVRTALQSRRSGPSAPSYMHDELWRMQAPLSIKPWRAHKAI